MITSNARPDPCLSLFLEEEVGRDFDFERERGIVLLLADEAEEVRNLKRLRAEDDVADEKEDMDENERFDATERGRGCG